MFLRFVSKVTYDSLIYAIIFIILSIAIGHDGKHRNLVPKYNGILDGFNKIIQQEGIKGLFKGCMASILSQSLARVSFITMYELRKIENQKSIQNKNIVIIKSSTESSLFTLVFINPMFVIKNRLILNVENKNSVKSVFENVVEIRKSHNIWGFYRGFSLSLALSAHGIILMYSYENLKEKMVKYDNLISINQQPLICGLISKLLASCLLFPLTTLRTRVQQNQYAFIDHQQTLKTNQSQKYTGLNDCFRKIMKDEGIKGFYKGLTPNLLKSVPSKGLFFYLYELLKAQSQQSQF